jgi:glutathione S-transferase
MLLLQFSTSHYCRKARLALGYKQIDYQVQNLTPGLHALKLKPLVGVTTLPVLLPQQPGCPEAIADSTAIFKFLEAQSPTPSLVPKEPRSQLTAWMLEDWLDESLGIAARFVYYEFRAGAGKSLDPSWFSQLVIQRVRQQYGINAVTADFAAQRLTSGLAELKARWETTPYLVGDDLSVADIAAAALLSPLARIPDYREQHPWLFEQIRRIHQICGEPLPPGLEATVENSVNS